LIISTSPTLEIGEDSGVKSLPGEKGNAKVDQSGHQLPLVGRLRVPHEGGKNGLNPRCVKRPEPALGECCFHHSQRSPRPYRAKKTLNQLVDGLRRTAAVAGVMLQRRIKLGSKTHGVPHSSIIVNNDLRSREKEKLRAIRKTLIIFINRRLIRAVRLIHGRSRGPSTHDELKEYPQSEEGKSKR
jgi:hypothetical protein